MNTTEIITETITMVPGTAQKICLRCMNWQPVADLAPARNGRLVCAKGCKGKRSR